MISFPQQPQHFMGADASFEAAQWVLIGIPYDGTCSYRPGTRFAPSAMREASWGLETYSPQLDRDLDAVSLADLGDLELPLGNRERVLEAIRQAAREVLSHDKHWAGMGGEHLVTLPVIEAYLERYPDLAVVHFDAHADLRDDYMGERYSHATVLRRVVDLIGPERLAQIGIRSGPKSEFDWMNTHHTLMRSREQLTTRLQSWGGRPVFLTVDLDVLDPSVLPGTGTPEPGGMLFTDFQEWLSCLTGLNLVGLDVVELSPPYDASGVSNVVAAKVLRECLLLSL